MKKITLSILALSLVLTTIYAQEKTAEAVKKDAKEYHQHPGKHRKQHHADFKKLNLSQEQQDKLIKINKDYRSGVADLKKQEATTTVKDYKAQMQALNKKRRSDVDNVFTKEQKDQLQQMRMERKGKFDTADKGGTEKMKSALGLSDDQSAKLKALRADTQKKIKEIRASNALSDARKKEQVAAVFKKQHEDMNSILTPEQVKKMERFKSRRINRMSK